MRIWFNHTISSLAEVIEMMRLAVPDLWVLASHERSVTMIAKNADKFISEHTPARYPVMPESYLGWALGICEQNAIDVFIPYLYREELSAYREDFAAAGVRLVTAGDPDVMELLEEKDAFGTAIFGMGIPPVPFISYATPQQFDDARAFMEAEWPEYELCTKPARGIYGSGFRILAKKMDPFAEIMSGSKLRMPIERFRTDYAASSLRPTMLLMPRFEGVESSTDFACLDGRYLGSVTRRKAAEHQTLHHDKRQAAMAQRLVEKFNLSGILNLQVLEDRDGTPYLLEVNSRTAGGIGQTLHTGVNLAALLLDALSGNCAAAPIHPQTTVKTGSRQMSYLLEE